MVMRIETSVQPFYLEVQELSEWTARPHKHNFFELVYIESGEGSQCINDHHADYKQGSIFLLPPLDCHSFIVNKPTRFVFVKFTGAFFGKDEAMQPDYSEWFNKLNYILVNYNREAGEVIKDASDRLHICNLVKGIQQEYYNQDSHSQSIIRANMIAVLNLLVRNSEKIFLEQAQSATSNVLHILNYIQRYLFDNEKLKVENMARQFYFSKNYLSEYFKKNIGEGLKEYIVKSKVAVAQDRIRRSGYSLKEVAYELGFTDASHLTKMIKKYGQPVVPVTAVTTCTGNASVA